MRVILVILAVVMLVIGWFVYTVYISLFPDRGPEGAEVRRVASTASKHLSNNPNVLSTTITDASADIGGKAVHLSVQLKDDTNAETVADLLTSTHKAVFGKKNTDIDFVLFLSWTLHGTSIDISFSATGPVDAEFVRLVLAPAGEATGIGGTIGNKVNYGEVSAAPTTLLQPGVPGSFKAFTMGGWGVRITSDKNGQFPTAPLDQIITAARQANTTGIIDLNTDGLAITGLVTDDTKSLTPQVAAPVIHAIGNCTTAGLTRLQLNNWALNSPVNVTDPWLAFTCQNGTWTPRHEGSTGQDETAILQHATEL